MISRIKLEKFKRIETFETDLDRINVLVGANNSGKSSVLQGIQFTIMSGVIRRYLSMETVSQERLLYLPSADFSVLRHGSPYTNYSGSTSSLTLTNDENKADGNPDMFSITLSKGRNHGNISITSNGNNKFRQQVTSYKELYSAYTPGLSGIPLNEKQVARAVLRKAAANGDTNLLDLNKLIGQVFSGSKVSVIYNPDDDIDIVIKVTIDGYTIPLELCGTGLLQIIQIMAYSIYFKPKLLLLDEPDEHLHPNNQIALCNALSLLANSLGLQIIISTHSRHMIASLEHSAKIIWMKNGSVCKEKFSSNYYNLLSDLDALDTFYSVVQGKYKIVILTEDSNTHYINKLLEYNEFDMKTTLVISYKSCSHVKDAIQLGSFIKAASKDCKVIIHRDKDFMTDSEIGAIKKPIEEEGLTAWISEETDIEAYFTSINHVAALTGKTEEEVVAWKKSILSTYHVDIQHKFESKRSDIKALLYSREGKLKKDKDVNCPDFKSLFGVSIPTESKNVIGKFLLVKMNEGILQFAGKEISLLNYSKYLKSEALSTLKIN